VTEPTKKLVLIEWVDSHSSTDRWNRVSDLEGRAKLLNVVSAGFLIKQTKDVVMLVSGKYAKSHDEELVPWAHGDICIPRKAIKKIKVLKP